MNINRLAFTADSGGALHAKLATFLARAVLILRQLLSQHLAGPWRWFFCGYCLVSIAHAIPASVATLEWNSVPETDIASYELSYGTESGSYTDVIDAGNHLTVDVPGLVPGTTYYFAVSAVNTSGMRSAFSQEITYFAEIQANEIPISAAATINSAENAAVAIHLDASDYNYDPLTFSVVGRPVHGTLSGDPPYLTYSPYPDFVGNDSFTFRSYDGTAYSAPATVSIHVKEARLIPQSGWSLNYVDSEDPSGYPATNAFDGDPSSFWHTRWLTNAPPPPHEIQINMGVIQNIGGFRYLPRQDSYSDGNIGQYEFYISMDGINWGNPVASGTFENSKTEKEVIFTAKAGQFIRLRSLSEASGKLFASCAELNLLSSRSTVTQPVNQPPAATSLWLGTSENNQLGIPLSASDPEGAALTYSLVTNPTHGRLTGTAPNLTYVPDAGFSGGDQFSFIVNDGALDSNVATVSITVNPAPKPPENFAPVFSSGPISSTATEDEAFSDQLTATDSNVGDVLTFQKVSGPSWLTVAQNGALGGTPTNADVGKNSFVVKVSDPSNASASTVIVINVTNTNDAPVFNVNPFTLLNGTKRIPYRNQTLALSAIDPDAGDTLTFSKISGPAWLTVAPDGTLGGTPSDADIGDNTFTVRATDSSNASASATLVIKVLNSNSSPSFSSNPAIFPNGSKNTPYVGQTLASVVSDPDAGDTLTFSKIAGPAWLTIAADGTLEGTPQASDIGTNNFFYKVKDSSNASASATLSISVTNTNETPVFSANPAVFPAGVEKTPYTGQTLASIATDADAGDHLTFSKVSGPSWLIVSPDGSLGGTPSSGDIGANTFVVNVTDSASASATATLLVTVASSNDAPVFKLNPVVFPAGTEKTPYAIQNLSSVATDPDAGDALVFSKKSGPEWLSISKSGAISGTPPANSAGTNEFKVRVTDKAGAYSEATLQVKINPNTLPVPWNLQGIGKVSIAGGAVYKAGVFTVTGAGALSAKADAGNFGWQILSGDGEIIARVKKLDDTGSAARVGLMIRESLATNSRNAFIGMDGDEDLQWLSRKAPGAKSAEVSRKALKTPAPWLRLVRKNNALISYRSIDGIKWTKIGNTNLNLPKNCYVGLFVGSGDKAKLNTSKFSNVRVKK